MSREGGCLTFSAGLGQPESACVLSSVRINVVLSSPLPGDVMWERAACGIIADINSFWITQFTLSSFNFIAFSSQALRSLEKILNII